jgi:hypothetical protein
MRWLNRHPAGLMPRSKHKPAHAAARCARCEEEFKVSFREKGSAALALLAAAFALSACGNIGFDTTGWFSKPLDLFGSKGGYTYSNLDEASQERPITANDLVDANGACPRAAAPASVQTAADTEAKAGDAADTAALLGGAVVIGMSECDVVARLGAPSAVNFGRAASGDRSLVLTFRAGPRPGVYRFTAGRLMEMDRIEEPATPAPAPAKKNVRKKKPAKPQQAPNAGNNT